MRLCLLDILQSFLHYVITNDKYKSFSCYAFSVESLPPNMFQYHVGVSKKNICVQQYYNLQKKKSLILVLLVQQRLQPPCTTTLCGRTLKNFVGKCPVFLQSLNKNSRRGFDFKGIQRVMKIFQKINEFFPRFSSECYIPSTRTVAVLSGESFSLARPWSQVVEAGGSC